MEDGREGCQDPAQLGQDVERVAPVNVPTTTTRKGRTVCSMLGNEFKFSTCPARNFLSFRVNATSRELELANIYLDANYRSIFPTRSFLL